MSYDVLDNCQVSRYSIDRILFKVKIWQKFRCFHDISLCFKSYLRMGTLKFQQTHPKVVSYDVLDNCQVSRNSIDRILLKVKIWQKFRCFHDISLCFKSYLEIGL